MRTLSLPACLAALALSGCGQDWPDPPPVSTVTLLAEHEEWRVYRQGRLVAAPGGAVIWVGLWDLPRGEVSLGSDEALSIVLPAEDAPAVAGTLRRVGQEVTLVPAEGSGILLRTGDMDGEAPVVETPVTGPLVLENDRSGNPTTLVLGSLGLRVHSEPGTDRLWLRAWDEDSPLIETFRLPDFYPVRPEWRVAARLVAYDEPRALRVPDVTGGMVEFEAPGVLEFELDGREHSLIVTAGPTSTSYFIMMWDSTATTTTYQGGRYLRADLVDESGWTVLDFNRAYNAPCVFTPHSVCSLPPRGNWMPTWVTAGEQRPARPAYE